MANGTTEKLEPPVKAQDSEGKDVNIEIDTNKKDDSGTINGKKVTNIKRKKKAKKSDKKTVLTADHMAKVKKVIEFEVAVIITVTIDCEPDPATITVEAFRGGKSQRKDVYKISHNEQDRLVVWIEKNVKEAEEPAENKQKEEGEFFYADLQFHGFIEGVTTAMPTIARALATLSGSPEPPWSPISPAHLKSVATAIWPPFLQTGEAPNYSPIGTRVCLEATILYAEMREHTAPMRGPFAFVTEEDDTSDLHIIFTGSGGKLNNPQVNPPPKRVTVDGYKIEIFWDPPLPRGTEVEVKIECPFPIEVDRKQWSVLI
jgi:hypothetical protein